MQKRSAAKVTFAHRWSNTCCSHPWWDGEADGVAGCRKAVLRKVQQELGVTTLREDDLRFVERIHYSSQGGGKWGECEVDYVFLAQVDVDTSALNANEVAAVRWVSRAQWGHGGDGAFLGMEITPWVALMRSTGLVAAWWDAVIDGSFQPGLEGGAIRRLGRRDAADME